MGRGFVDGLHLAVLLVILTLTSPIAQAKTAYSMPTFGASWASQTLVVNVPAQPTAARDIVARAVEIWNQAQLWFKTTYFPKGNAYTFLIGKHPANVLVDFSDYWSVSNYCPSIPLGVEGCTTLRWNLANNITQAIVFLDTKRLTQPNNDSIFLVLHEFGHALGLPDLPLTPTSTCQFQDLLCLYYLDQYPSTLDLYTLHELAGGNRQTIASLPSNIPYSNYIPSESVSLPPTIIAEATSAASKAPTSTAPLEGWESNQLTTILFAIAIFSSTLILGASFSKRRGGTSGYGGPGGI